VIETAMAWIEEADAAAAAGDIAQARRLLTQAAADAPDRMDVWMKLAAMCRAAGDVRAALRAVHGALAVQPLDFMALLLKASLQERLGDPLAGQTYSHALAQRPEGEPPAFLTATVAHAEHHAAAYLANREALLADTVAGFALSPDERHRMERFRGNIVRRTRPFHSEPARFHYPGLREMEFHERRHFPWLAGLEAETDAIQAELESVAKAEREELIPYIQYAPHEPVRQWQALNHSRDWTAIHLIRNGRVIDATARHCPRTMAALEAIGQPRIDGCSPNAMFSLLAPGTTIPPHTGVSNCRLVCHLPLVVPEGCWFRVGAETRLWRRGEAFVFDDTIEHEAANPSTDLRVVLIFDIWHPDLAGAEREAVGRMMAADIGGEGGGL
jgi:hypothetical protein